MREDEHRPSLLDPAEYDFICAFYQGDSSWMMRGYQDEMEVYEQTLQGEHAEIFMGNWLFKSTCDHCGAAFNHGVLFRHLPSDELIHVGHICAANTVGLPDKAAKARKKAERLAKDLKEQDDRFQAGAEWRSQNVDMIAWLDAQGENAHSFIVSMRESISKWGRLTERQTNAVANWRAGAERRKAREIENEKRLETAPPLVEGRRSIEGVVISTKWKDTQYGSVLKMLVEEDDGNRVFGTVPQSIHMAFSLSEDIARLRVRLVGTVTRSDKDEHFGFFGKPTNAEVL